MKAGGVCRSWEMKAGGCAAVGELRQGLPPQRKVRDAGCRNVGWLISEVWQFFNGETSREIKYQVRAPQRGRACDVAPVIISHLKFRPDGEIG